MSGMTREILLLVGTDHHAFQRAVQWADARQKAHPEEQVFIQYGKSQAPTVATGEAFLSPERMREAVARADVVITHGGPGTISDARHAGHRPVVFPRDPTQGEHVDDHQQRFAGWCHRRGLVHVAMSVDDLDAVVAKLGDQGTRGGVATDPSIAAAISRVADLLDSGAAAAAVRPGAPVVLHLAGSSAEIASAEAALGGIGPIMVLGDVAAIWRSGIEQNRSCDCGERFADCEFWTLVGNEAFGGWEQAITDGIPLRAQRDPGASWSLARRYLGRRQRAAVLDFAAPYRALFGAARSVSRSDIICVSSSAASALAWSHDRQLDIRSVRLSRGLGHAAVRYRGLPAVAMSSAGQEYAQALSGLLADAWVNAAPTGASIMGDHPPMARLGYR
jgi:UDP-N-acetylglucosamine transferase subunit ALG13